MLTRFKTVLGKKTKLTEDVYLLRFDLVEPKELNFMAGQYMISLIPQKEPGQLLRRLYSITSSPDTKNSFELMIKVMPGGVGSTYLTSLNEGQEMLFDGPAGIFTLKETTNAKVFLATGTGLAPMRSMLKKILNSKSEVSNKFEIRNSKLFLFWGGSYFKDVCLLDELKSFEKNLPNFKLFLCISRETSLDQIPEGDRKYYHLGRVPTALEKYWEEIKDAEFNICGNQEVVEGLKNYLFAKVTDKTKVHFEKF